MHTEVVSIAWSNFIMVASYWPAKILDKPKFLTKKSHVTQPNRHHDENPSYYDSYHITENANTKIIPR